MLSGPPYIWLLAFLIHLCCCRLTSAQPRVWISEVHNSFYNFTDAFVEIYDGGRGNITLSNISLEMVKENNATLSISLHNMMTDHDGFLVLSLDGADEQTKNFLENIQNETVTLKLTIPGKSNDTQIINSFKKEKGWSDVISCFQDESTVNSIVLVGKDPSKGKINDCPLSPVRLDLLICRSPFNLTLQLLSRGIDHFPLTNHIINFFENTTLIQTLSLHNYSMQNKEINISFPSDVPFDMNSTYNIRLEFQVAEKLFVILESLYFGAQNIPVIILEPKFKTYPDKNSAQWVSPAYLQLVPSSSSNFVSCYCEVSTSTYNPFVKVDSSVSRDENCEKKCNELISIYPDRSMYSNEDAAPPSASGTATPSSASGSATPSSASGSATPSSANGSATPTSASGTATPSSASRTVTATPSSPDRTATSASPDGTATSASPNGTATSASPNGSATSASPNGTATSASPNGTATSASPNGTATSASPNGTATSASPNGTATSASPNGTATSASPNGTATSASPNGTATSASPNGTATSASPNGTATSTPLTRTSPEDRTTTNPNTSYSVVTYINTSDIKSSTKIIEEPSTNSLPTETTEEYTTMISTTFRNDSSTKLENSTLVSNSIDTTYQGLVTSTVTMTTEITIQPLYINEVKVGLRSNMDSWIELKGIKPFESVSSYVLVHNVNGQAKGTTFSLSKLNTTNKERFLNINFKTPGASQLLKELDSKPGLLRLLNSRRPEFSDCVAYQIGAALLEPKLVKLCPSCKVMQITHRELSQNWTIGLCGSEFKVLEPSVNQENKCPSLQFSKDVYMKILKRKISADLKTYFISDLVQKLSAEEGCMLSSAFFLHFSLNSSRADINIHAVLATPDQTKLNALYMCFKTLFLKKPITLKVGSETVTVHRCYNSSYIIPTFKASTAKMSTKKQTIAFVVALVVVFVCLIGGIMIYMRYKRKSLLGVLGMARYDADQDDLLVNMEDVGRQDTNFRNPTYSQLSAY